MPAILVHLRVRGGKAQRGPGGHTNTSPTGEGLCFLGCDIYVLRLVSVAWFGVVGACAGGVALFMGVA